MNAVFRQNLTDALAVDANDVDTASETGDAPADDHNTAGFCRTNAPMHVGRERLPEGRAWGEEGGSQMGVAHAPLTALVGCDSGADSRPAAQIAAGCRREAADRQEDRAPVIVHQAMRPLHSANSPGVSRGTVLPSFRSPTLFPSEVSRQQATREGETGR
jgi:hypothetical protein